MQVPWRSKILRLPFFVALLTMAAVLAVACSSAAPAAPEPADTGASSAAPAAAPAAESQPAQTDSGSMQSGSASAAPTAVPQAAMESGAMEARRDTLTILTASYGNEIYNSRYISGDKGIWWYPMQERAINADDNLQLTDKGIVVKWELTDDNMGWVYTIRDDATFHDGSPVTAEDIAFSMTWAIHENAVSRVRQRLVKIIDEPATVTGDNTVKITFTQPYGALPVFMSETVASGGSAGIVHKAGTIDVADPDGNGAAEYEADPNPYAAGPFNQVEHLRGEKITYEVWDDHFRTDRSYAFDTLIVELVAEQSTQMAALQAGKADIIPADLTVLDQILDTGASIVYSPESTLIWINANSCSPEQPEQAGGAGFGKDLQGRDLMCADQRVRYALDYAIDKTAIQAFFGGPEVFEIKGTAAVSPSGLGYSDAPVDGLPNGLDPFPYDGDKARALLTEAGWANPDNPGGEAFNYGEEFNIWTWPAGATAPRIVEMAELVCSMWEKELGFECKVNVGEEVSIKDKQYSGSIPGQYLVRSNEHDYDVGSKYKGRFASPDGGYISYDSHLQTVIDDGLAVVDPAMKAEAYNSMHNAVHTKHYDFAPGYLNAPYGVAEHITNWEPWPIKVHPTALWTIEFAP